jgi:hypothetical protein
MMTVIGRDSSERLDFNRTWPKSLDLVRDGFSA